MTNEPKTSTRAAGQMECTTPVRRCMAASRASLSPCLGARKAERLTRSAGGTQHCQATEVAGFKG